MGSLAELAVVFGKALIRLASQDSDRFEGILWEWHLLTLDPKSPGHVNP